MDIDWKKVSQCPGYISLKACYINDVTKAAATIARNQHPMRKKAEFLKLFNWVINRAKHYAYVTDKPIEHFLNKWEKSRGHSWWLNAYGNSYQPKLNSNNLKPQGIKGLVKYYKTDPWYTNDPKRRKERISSAIKYFHRQNKPTQIKLRWTNHRKKRQAYFKKLEAKQSP